MRFIQTISHRRQNSRPSNRPATRALATSVAALLGLIVPVHAQTWLNPPVNNNWNNAANWTPANIPDAAGETATFGASTVLNPTVTAQVTIAGITFNAAAPAYSIVNEAGLTIVGAGISNNSAALKTITNDLFANLDFQNAATAANTRIVNSSGFVNFFNTATAGTSTIVNSDPLGLVSFFDTSTAGTATINNTGVGAGPNPGASVVFFGNATAAGSTINNSGAFSQALFSGTPTAGTATINNSGANSSTSFITNATAGTATITNTGSASSIAFNNASTAANSTIVNNGALSAVEFFNSATAANAKITNQSATGLVNFFDTSTAANAVITNSGSGAAPSAVVSFFNRSTAANAVIVNSGSGSQTTFGDLSTAANAKVTNTGANSTITITGTASGGSATFVNANPTAQIDVSLVTNGATTVGSVAGNGALMLGANQLTVGGNNTSTTFSGIIQDGGAGGGVGGSLVKVGTGALILTGANTFTGGTTLRAGSISVGSAQALGKGNFALQAGTLRATGATQAINVGGNYSQTGGELNLRIGSASDGGYDRLAVLGTASLGGRLKLEAINGFTAKRGDQFTVVSANGGVKGQFATVEQNVIPNRPLLSAQIAYAANQAVVTIVQGAFLPFAVTPNQIAVANALDRVTFNAGAGPLLDSLDTLALHAIPAALDQIAPEEVGAVFEASRSAAKMQAFQIQYRLDEIRAGNGGTLPNVAGSSKDYKSSKEVVSSEPRMGFFVNGSGEFAQVNGNSNARGYDLDAGGVTLGLDYKFCEHFAAGVFANYTRTRADLTGAGRSDIDSFRGGLYATAFGGGAYVNAFVGGGYNSYDIKRGGFGGNPRGDTEGGEFNAFISAGYDMRAGAITVSPFASYQYTYTQVNGYRENGSLAPLRIDSESAESSRTNVGVRLTSEVNVGSVVLVPELRASWQHEFGDVSYTTTSQFGFGGPAFQTRTPGTGRDSLLLSAGFTLRLSPTVATYAFYDGELGRSDYSAHNAVVGMRVSY